MPHDPDALARIRHAATYGTIYFSRPHAVEEMRDANVHAEDVRMAIRSATVAIPQSNQRFRLEGGKASDGEELIVVVREIRQGLFVVTVF